MIKKLKFDPRVYGISDLELLLVLDCASFTLPSSDSPAWNSGSCKNLTYRYNQRFWYLYHQWTAKALQSHQNCLSVKPVLSGHLKTDKTKIWMTDGRLMKVARIAECSPWSILQCLKRPLGWKPNFGCFWEWSLWTGFTEYTKIWKKMEAKAQN